MKKNLRKLRIALSAMLTLSIAAGSLPAAFAAEGEGQGLWAEYYSGRNLESYTAGGLEATVDHAWTETNLPAGLSSVENFSARWVGRIRAEQEGSYTIYSNVDDGAKIYIDGELAIDDAGPHFPFESSASFTWRRDSYHTIVIEYYNGELGGTMQLKWTPPGGSKEIIPKENLYLTDEADVDWVIEGNSIAARGHIYWEDTAAYNVVLESYDEEGVLVDTIEAARPSDHAAVWTTENMPYADGLTYKAYVTDEAGTQISDTAEKVYQTDVTLEVDAGEVTGEVSPYLNGACIEDVNHELYGGIWSQMVFGESFAESPSLNLEDFTSAGGEWKTEETSDGPVLAVDRQDNGPKMVLNDTDCESGMFSADVWFEGGGPVGFIVKTSQAKPGADNFYGYEVGLMNGQVKIARHENNYDSATEKYFSCADAKPGTWVNLKVETTRDNIAVYVNENKVGDFATIGSLTSGAMALRAWDGAGKYKNFQFQAAGGELQNIPVPIIEGSVSGMWESVERGTAEGAWALDKTNPYTKSLIAGGAQSQEIRFISGEGAIGVNNMGLNRKGMNFEADKEYEGYVYIRSEDAAEVYVVLESADGSVQYGETKLEVAGGSEWAKYSFTITPDAKDAAGRMSIELRQPGSVDLAYAFLQPGEWGRYKGLQIRKDVAEKLEEQNLSLLRFGGSMINDGDYKWKNMLGAPEDRPVYGGTWYSYSSFGFGIMEFLNLCEALGIMGIPTFNSLETAQDMADFIDFATGTDENNEWVQRRIEMGHPEPYNLPYLQIGNEETVNTEYAARFNNLAGAIWEKAPDMILIAADLVYEEVITDPDNFTGAASGITNLDGHKAIMEFAKSQDCTVYFDVHTWTHNPASSAKYTEVLISFYNALHQVCPGTDTKVIIFEYNALAHNLERALANGYATIDMEKHSDMFPIVCSANCLQVDGHNDNGWDQGLVFMDNDSSWYQPPAYVTQMSGENYLPNRVAFTMDNPSGGVNCVATSSDDGDTLVLKFLNSNARQLGVAATLENYESDNCHVTITSLTAENLTDTNTAEEPEKVKPTVTAADNALRNGRLNVLLEPYSYTVVRIEKGSLQTLEEAKAAAEEAVAGIKPDNGVTAEDYMDAVEAVLTNDAIQAEWSEAFTKTEATTEAPGSLRGVISLTLDGQTAEVEIDAVIPQLTTEIIRGDVTRDGKIDIQDVMAACKIVARNNAGQEPTENEKLRADMNEDGRVRIEDIMAICRKLAQQNAQSH